MRLGRRALLGGATAGTLLCLSGCAALRSEQADGLLRSPPSRLPRRFELESTPFFPQTEHHCGPAALATVLVASGVRVVPDDLAPQVYLPGREGSLQVEMLAAARRRDRLAARLQPRLDALLLEVAEGRPAVVLQNLGLAIAPLWHYAVVFGFDIEAGEILLRSGTIRRERMGFTTFDHTWARSGRWACAVTDPPQLPSHVAEVDLAEACVAFERVASAKRALLAYESALSRWPDNLTLQMGRGNSLYATGRKEEAAVAFEQAAISHASPAAWINHGEVVLELGDPARAAEAARRAAAAGGLFATEAADLLRRATSPAR